MLKQKNRWLPSPVTLGAFFTLFLALLFPVTSDAQSEFDKFRMVLKSGERADGINGEVNNGFLTATRVGGGAIEVPVSDIRALEIKTGSETGTGFALGALGGALLLLVTVMQVEADENAEVDGSRVVTVGAALMLGGGAIGAMIGSRSSSWQKVPLDDYDSRVTEPIRYGVALRFSF